MATSSEFEFLGFQYHVRSISLPSRLQNPNAIKVESQLNKLRFFESSSLFKTTPLTIDSIQCGLIGLVELYNNVQELMGSPTTQADLRQYSALEEVLEKSVEVMDSCTTIRDMFSTIKERVQVLQSALRRKNGDPSIGSDIKAFICFRNKVQKEATKRLRILKKMESRFSCLHDLNMDPHLNILFGVLNRVSSITISIVRLILVFLASQESKLKHGGWSLIGKLMLKKSTSFEEEKGMFFVNIESTVDSALVKILEKLRSSPDIKNHVQIVRRRLDVFSSSIEGLENGLEGLFRKLISNRVMLLNILNH